MYVSGALELGFRARKCELRAMKIKELCLEERPREKLKQLGPSALSKGELLSVLLRTGTSSQNVVELSQELLKFSDGKLSVLSEMSLERLCSVKGIGPDKAATISAAFELGRRLSAEPTLSNKEPIRTAEAAYNLVAPKLRFLDHEEFWVLFMNRANNVLALEQLSCGNVSNTSVDVPRIVKKCLEKNATAVIMFHNHPSGNPHPGSNDISATNSVRKALETMEKSLLDHIIVAGKSYYSFAMEKVFDI